MMIKLRLITFSLSMLFFMACQFGSAQFESLSKDVQFDASGTAFAFQSSQRLYVAMTWLALNPEDDLNEQGPDFIQKLQQEFFENDALILVLEDVNNLTANRIYQGNGPLKASIHFGKRNVSQNRAEQTMSLKIASIDLAGSAKHISGHLEFWIEKTAIRAQFYAPLVKNNERAQLNWNKLADTNLTLLSE